MLMENSFLLSFSPHHGTCDAQSNFMRILQRASFPELVGFFSTIIEKVDQEDAQASASLALFIQLLHPSSQKAETYCRAIFFAVVMCLQKFDGDEGECNVMLDIVQALRSCASKPVDLALRELLGTINLIESKPMSLYYFQCEYRLRRNVRLGCSVFLCVWATSLWSRFAGFSCPKERSMPQHASNLSN